MKDLAKELNAVIVEQRRTVAATLASTLTVKLLELNQEGPNYRSQEVACVLTDKIMAHYFGENWQSPEEPSGEEIVESCKAAAV